LVSRISPSEHNEFSGARVFLYAVAVRVHPNSGSVVLCFGEVIQDVVAIPVKELAYNGGHVDGAITYSRGGCAANVAVGCAQLGVSSRFLGHVGADAIGDQLISQMRRAGVDVIAVRRGQNASSLSIVKPDGDTALVFNPGASRTLDVQDVRREHLTGVAIVHVNSHHLYAPETRDAFGQLIGLVQSADVFLSVDVSASNRLVDYGARNYREDLAIMRPDVLLANEKEAHILGLFEDFPEGVSTVVVHRGSKSTIVLSKDCAQQSFEVPPVEDIVDVIGGGDAFAAGYLSAMLNKRPIEDAVAQAHKLAAEIIRQPGVEFAVERNPEVRRHSK
jgi:sugar/nucleoside kinase (ribokinase family)